LQRIAARVPVAAVTNGNADLETIGLSQHFAFNLTAREHGAAKPEPGHLPRRVRAAGVPCAQVLHVGDHAEMDVAGAMRAGLRGCWDQPRRPRMGRARTCGRTWSSTPSPRSPTG
jgi:putative hydrolase of the HAD superfamily